MILIDPLAGREAPPRGQRMSATGDVFWNPANGKVSRDERGVLRVVAAAYPSVRKAR